MVILEKFDCNLRFIVKGLLFFLRFFGMKEEMSVNVYDIINLFKKKIELFDFGM